MDPYLENPTVWPDVHLNLISEAQATLNRQLRPRYFSRAEERVYISERDDPGRSVLVPDVTGKKRSEEAAPLETGGVATLAEPIVVPLLIDDEVRERRIVIRDAENHEVVTVIEIVSPSNKKSGAYGRGNFLSKRREVLNSTANWVEIDLLRDGIRTVPDDVWDKGEYFVHISRPLDRRTSHVWPLRITDPLPPIPIPLRPEDGGTTLDLQAVFDAVYDRCGYDLQIDYDREPVPPLAPELHEWARKQIEDYRRELKRRAAKVSTADPASDAASNENDNDSA